MSNRSFYTAMLSIMFCSAAFAIQPTVRAGSISLNSGIKPATNAITKNTTSAALTAARGSALPKFSGNVVSTGISNNTTQNNALDELRQQINEIKTTQQGLATRDDVNNAIATADLPNANSNLNNALTQIRSTNETLQSSVDSIQQQTDQFSETFNTNVDNRLKVRGLIDSTNAPAFPTENKIRDIIDATAETKGYVTNTALNAKNFVTADSDTILNLATKADIQPATLATNIAHDEDAKNALHDAGFAKNSDLTDLVTELDATNLVKVRDLEPFITDTDLDAELITDRLGDTYVKTDKFTKDEIVTKLGDEYVKDTDFAGKLASSGVATNESVTELASNVQGLSTNVQTLSGNLDTVSGNLNTLSGNVGTLSGNVQTLTTKVNGGVNDEGSMLHDIYTNETIRAALKGDQGEQGVQGEKGEKGEKGDPGEPGISGASFDFRGTRESAPADNECTTATRGTTYYNSVDGNMYICSCSGDTNDTCAYAAAPVRGGDGAQGEPGLPAKPVAQEYCENNINIVSALYPAYSTVESCATFPYNYYNAITTGAKAYCISLVARSVDLTTNYGIGAKLESTFGTGTVTKLRTDGLAARVNEKSFVDECEERYNEIMSGTDGEDAKTPEQVYCETNFEIVHALYSNYVVRPEDCADATKFSSDRYAAILGGAKAYCLSLSQNALTLDLNAGIGKKLVDTFGADKMQEFKSSPTLESRINISGFKVSKEGDQTDKFIPACETRYNEIMSGDKGDKGDTGENGEDGKTFKPIFNPTTGKLHWELDPTYTGGDEVKITRTDDELNSLIASKAISATKEAVNTDDSGLASAVGSRAVKVVKEQLALDDSGVSNAVKSKAVSAVKADLNLDDSAISQSITSKSVNAVKTALNTSGSGLSNLVNAKSVAAVEDAIATPSSTLATAIDNKSTTAVENALSTPNATIAAAIDSQAVNAVKTAINTSGSDLSNLVNTKSVAAVESALTTPSTAVATALDNRAVSAVETAVSTTGSNLNSAIDTTSATAVESALTTPSTAVATALDNRAVSAVETAIDTTGSNLATAIEDMSVDAVTDAINDSSSILSAKISAKSTDAVETAIKMPDSKINNLIVTVEDLKALINSGALRADEKGTIKLDVKGAKCPDSAPQKFKEIDVSSGDCK